MTRTARTLQTVTQNFDVEINDCHLGKTDPTGQTIEDHPALSIVVMIGSHESPWGWQKLEMVVTAETNLSVALRDWADLLKLLPQVIMEHHL